MSDAELHNGIQVPLQQFNDSILLRIKLDNHQWRLSLLIVNQVLKNNNLDIQKQRVLEYYKEETEHAIL